MKLSFKFILILKKMKMYIKDKEKEINYKAYLPAKSKDLSKSASYAPNWKKLTIRTTVPMKKRQKNANQYFDQSRWCNIYFYWIVLN